MFSVWLQLCGVLEDNAAEFVASYSYAKPINKATRKSFSQLESIMQDMKILLTPEDAEANNMESMTQDIPSSYATPVANLDCETSSPSETPNPEANNMEMMDDQSDDAESAELNKAVVQD